MPYIAKERREKLDADIESLQWQLREMGNAEGDLNYVISRLIGDAFLNETRYHTIARITGVLENVKDEFYRRLAAPYEWKAIAKNGDLPEFKKLEKSIVKGPVAQMERAHPCDG